MCICIYVVYMYMLCAEECLEQFHPRDDLSARSIFEPIAFFFTREGKGGGGCNFTSLQRVESGTLSIRLNTREFIPILSFLYVSGTSAVCHVSIAFHGSFYSGCRGEGETAQLAIFPPCFTFLSFFRFFFTKSYVFKLKN